MKRLIFCLKLFFVIWWMSGCVSTTMDNQNGIKSIYYKDMMDYLVVFEIEDPGLMEVPEFPDVKAKPPFITLPVVQD